MPKKKYKFRLFSAVLATVCIILVGDAVAPTAAIGNSMYIWWAVMLIGFFVPYALISAELGTQYPSEGGMYTWIKKAFGKKWAGRVAWFYWVNFPLWIASLADLITTMIMQMFGIEMEMWMVLAIQLFYIFLVTILGMLRISQSDWVSNIGAVIKMILLGAIGCLGLYVLFTKGTANPIEGWQDFVPLASADGGIDWAGLGFVALIIFNMLGFEVVGTFYDDMDKPKSQIPKAIILGGILIAIFYIFPSFGMGVGTPFEEIQTNTGFLDSYNVLMANAGISEAAIQAITITVGGLFILTLISNISSWTFGVYSVTAYAAEDGVFPKSWAKRNKDGAPYVVSIWTGLISAILAVAGIVIAYVFPEEEELSNMFWAFFSLSLVCLLLSYIPMFAAFIKLHKKGQQVKNGYWLKVGPVLRWIMGLIPLLLLFVALFFVLVPYPDDFALVWEENKVLIISTAVCIVVGELMVLNMARKDHKKKIARKTKR
ncbi:APC family permease [Candidatus Saccharibacteria bacterium]|nr:APC family permease [Candidatus Saccharibacteria bacterium]